MSARAVAARLASDPESVARIQVLLAGLRDDECDDVLRMVEEHRHQHGDASDLLEVVGTVRDLVLEERWSEFRRTDPGNARRLASMYGDRIRWVGREKRFYWYDGTLWLPDYGRQLDAFAKESVRLMMGEAAECADWLREGAQKHALRSASAQRIRAAVDLAISEPGIAIDPSAFDADPLSLNCPNGLLDLRIVELRGHRPEDLCTQITAVPFMPEARSDTWERFLERTIPDAALRDWAQRAFGYCIAGLTDADLIVLVHGPGGTGKSTLVHAVLAALGTYSTTTPFETFGKHERRPGQATPELESLIGHRLVASFEGAGSLRLSEERLKGIASGDRSRSRGLFRDEREYAATFKVVLVTNDRPLIRGDDDAVWRRLRILPLVQRVPDGEIDRELRARMQRDPAIMTAVLAWLVQGWRAYRERGLEPVAGVEEATRAYRDAVDRTWAFVNAELVLEPDGFLPNAKLDATLKAWTEATDTELQRSEVVKTLKEKGCRSGTVRLEGNPVRGWSGVRLKSAQEHTPDLFAAEEARHA